MMSFERAVIDKTVCRLLNGEDYRSEIVNSINTKFLDFSLKFLKEIALAKFDNKSIDVDWYKANFITNNNLSPDDIAIYACINKKTITNIYKSASKEIVLDVAERNYDYLSKLIDELGQDKIDELDIKLTISYKDVHVDLTLAESLLVINVLATKKMAIRGGAWSSIGKKVEKPLMLKLCEGCSVPRKSINAEVFHRDGSLDYDREVDFKLISKDGKELRCEVKLMGKGNPESADAVIARDSDLFVADTLSDQNKRQLDSLGVKWIELKGHSAQETLNKFKNILTTLNVL